MLLDYLFQNFLEERRFAETAGTTPEALAGLIAARVFPAPSYVCDVTAQTTSFVARQQIRQTCRFHLRKHLIWHSETEQHGLRSEMQARAYFFARYNSSKQAFLAEPLGSDLHAAAPEIAGHFDIRHAKATWEHFLNGVYGVCTRDGRPESIFLKQAGVMYIERLATDCPNPFPPELADLLRRAVDFLDKVASEFAPHEVPLSSRQRCVINVRSRLSDAAGVAV